MSMIMKETMEEHFVNDNGNDNDNGNGNSALSA